MTTTSPPTTTAVAARAVHASKIYGSGETEVRALDDVDVDFERGAFTAIMGPSGSGKSTLLHCIAGLDSLTSGQMFLGDIELSSLNEKHLTQLRRDRIGFIFQTYNLIPTLTALREHHAPDGARRTQARRRVGRPRRRHGRACAPRLDHRPSELSGGQQQRVAVARALASRPEIIFADEPTGNLDSRSGAEILEFMRTAVEELGQTIVMVTHDPNAAAYASRVVFLSRRAHHRRAPRPDRRRHSREDARAGRLAVWKVTRKGLAAHKVRFAAHRARRHHRRRVHGGHVGADRDHPADVRRPLRQHLPHHRRRRSRAPGARQ